MPTIPDRATPHLLLTPAGTIATLRPGVTTIGHGDFTDITLTGPGVSALHAEITRHGPTAYVTDLGTPGGTAVNGRRVAVRVLTTGDIITFGTATCQARGIPAWPDPDPPAHSPLTRREHDVLTALCRPAQTPATFITPATTRDIAAELAVTDAAVKQHLLNLYAKLEIPPGTDRRTTLANTAISLGLVSPQIHGWQYPVPAPEKRDPLS